MLSLGLQPGFSLLGASVVGCPKTTKGAVAVHHTGALVFMIQLTNAGLTCSSDVNAMAKQFEKMQALRLPQLLDPELVRIVSRRMECGNWIPREHGKIGREVCLDDAIALHALHFAANTPQFIRLIEQVTQCGSIANFSGRVYRMVPGSDHYDSWHDDVTGDRLVGISVNLSPRPYAGGIFRLRGKDGQVLCDLPNVVAGDAILFRISPELTHMVTPVEGTESKTAFAGWFKSGCDDFFSILRQPKTGR
jgi:hypothetical protein